MTYKSVMTFLYVSKKSVCLSVVTTEIAYIISGNRLQIQQLTPIIIMRNIVDLVIFARFKFSRISRGGQIYANLRISRKLLY